MWWLNYAGVKINTWWLNVPRIVNNNKVEALKDRSVIAATQHLPCQKWWETRDIED